MAGGAIKNLKAAVVPRHDTAAEWAGWVGGEPGKGRGSGSVSVGRRSYYIFCLRPTFDVGFFKSFGLLTASCFDLLDILLRRSQNGRCQWYGITST